MPTRTPHFTSAHPPVTGAGSVRAPVRILLVDDHPAVRLGARALLDAQPDMQVVAHASGAEDAIGQLTEPIDLAILDYHLGDGEDGLWLTAELKRTENPPHVLVYSAFADGALAVMALVAGADGLLGKHELADELCCAIRRLARGQHNLPAVSPSIAHVMRSQLEPQDQAIFGMLLHGIAPEAIAERLETTHEDVHARRLLMLRSFKPARPPSVLPMATRAPLDYERARRRPARAAA
ncbi:MAG TPA: response regulator transcription factor [Solirubrobacteraceae bacterium]|nr:response regulator transcription factor [Solirubrobacteraceae bacterium]